MPIVGSHDVNAGEDVVDFIPLDEAVGMSICLGRPYAEDLVGPPCGGVMVTKEIAQVGRGAEQQDILPLCFAQHFVELGFGLALGRVHCPGHGDDMDVFCNGGFDGI